MRRWTIPKSIEQTYSCSYRLIQSSAGEHEAACDRSDHGFAVLVDQMSGVVVFEVRFV
jgi:hypothetical protein